MLEEGEHPPAQGTHQGRRLDGLQFGEGCCCQEVLAPVGTPLGSAFAAATNPPRAHTSSREIMKVFFMTISMVASRHQRRGDLSVISGPSGIFRSETVCVILLVEEPRRAAIRFRGPSVGAQTRHAAADAVRATSADRPRRTTRPLPSLRIPGLGETGGLRGSKFKKAKRTLLNRDRHQPS